MIESIRKATNEEWDSMVDATPSTIYFQTREWFDIWSEYCGFESDTRLISLAGGKKVLLPLTRIKLLKGLLAAHFLSPKGMGGFVADAELGDGEREELFGVLKGIRMLYCAVNPYDPITNRFPELNGKDLTQVLDLSPGMAAIRKRWSKGHYSAVKKGMREGISVQTAATEEEWRSYFRLYQDNLARWGNATTNAYSWPLFQSMCRRGSGKIRLWLASYEGEVISGALCFYHNNHVAYWHSASSEKFFRKLNASHVLQHHIIEDACDRGFLLYDFLPSGGISGVADFKKGFGAESRTVHTYTSSGMQLSSSIRSRLRNTGMYRLLMKDTGF